MNALLNTFADFVGSNGLTAFIEGFILVFFVSSVATAMLSCLLQPLQPGSTPPSWATCFNRAIRKLASASNFTHGSTIVAGLVLTAATGVLGKPADIKITTE